MLSHNTPAHWGHSDWTVTPERNIPKSILVERMRRRIAILIIRIIAAVINKAVCRYAVCQRNLDRPEQHEKTS